MKTKKYRVNGFYLRANNYLKYLTEEKEIEKIDETELLLREIENMIKNEELIILEIKGKVRLGKSTLAMALGKVIFDCLVKYKYQKKDKEFGIRNIARDQQEYSKLMRNPETMFTVIVTDEDNELEVIGTDNQTLITASKFNMTPKETIQLANKLIATLEDTEKQYTTWIKKGKIEAIAKSRPTTIGEKLYTIDKYGKLKLIDTQKEIISPKVKFAKSPRAPPELKYYLEGGNRLTTIHQKPGKLTGYITTQERIPYWQSINVVDPKTGTITTYADLIKRMKIEELLKSKKAQLNIGKTKIRQLPATQVKLPNIKPLNRVETIAERLPLIEPEVRNIFIPIPITKQ